MVVIDKKHLQRYQEETKDLLYQRVYAILWVGIILIPLFSILDYVVVREYLKLFIVYRITCSVLFLVLLFFYYKDIGHRHPFLIAITAYFIAGATISLMIVILGGYGSFYYAGLLMVLITFAAILPLNVIQSAVSGYMLFFIYIAPIFIFSKPTEETTKIFFSNSFFFFFIIALMVIKCYEDTRARKREFNLRMELDSLSERLSYYAHNLEDEVEKRAKALEESELRYRELYENIIDMVILVDRNNKILMANPRFYEAIGIPNIDSLDGPFIAIVHPEDAPIVEVRMLARLLNEYDVKDFQFRIVNQEGAVFDVECNARVIKKDGNLIGFQMVIRDITERKRLERDLLESYKHVQNARAATILGLAKLAEYRDEATGAHLERIREYARIIAKELADKSHYRGYITQKYIDDIYSSSILHDIGKVGIPDSILLKPGKLTKEEFEVVKRHSALGGDALKAAEAQIEGKSFLTLGKEIAYYHHEKWDGAGYPRGLKGEEIPLSARIVALADVYDALTSRRVYKDAYSHEKAKEIIVSERGKHFAPDVVDAFMAHEDEFKKIREELLGVETQASEHAAMS